MEEKVIVEGEFEEIQDQEHAEIGLQPQIEVESEVRITLMSDGQIMLNVSGKNQSIFMIEALMKYGRVEVDKLWQKISTSPEV